MDGSVSGRDTLTALGAPAFDRGSTRPRAHLGPESVLALPTARVWLVGPLHTGNSLRNTRSDQVTKRDPPLQRRPRLPVTHRRRFIGRPTYETPQSARKSSNTRNPGERGLERRLGTAAKIASTKSAGTQGICGSYTRHARMIRGILSFLYGRIHRPYTPRGAGGLANSTSRC